MCIAVYFLNFSFNNNYAEEEKEENVMESILDITLQMIFLMMRISIDYS